MENEPQQQPTQPGRLASLKLGRCGIEHRVVNFIGWTLIISVLGGIAITAIKQGPMEWLQNIALVLAGALGALLANTGRGSQGTPQNPTSVEVKNPPENPVNVQETKTEGAENGPKLGQP